MLVPGIVTLILNVPYGSFPSRAKERSARHISIWCIANLCRWSGNCEQLQDAYPMLEKVITNSNDPELLSEAAWAICRLFHIQLKPVEMSPDFIPKLVRLLRYVRL